MYQDQLRVIFALSIMACSGAGCARNVPISPSAVSQLLMTHLAQHCSEQSISIRAGVVGAIKAQHALSWFNDRILADRGFRQVSVSSGSSDRHGELSYQDKGTTFDVAWRQIDLPGIDTRDRLTVRACIFVPSKIEIIDSAYDNDGINGRVLFRERTRLSLFGQRIHDAGFLNSSDLLEDFEYVAELHKDDSGQWIIRSLNAK